MHAMGHPGLAQSPHYYTPGKHFWAIFTQNNAIPFGLFCSKTRHFQDIRSKSGKSEMHRMTSKWPWTLISQKYPVYIKYLPQTSKFLFVSLCDQLFLRYKVVKNRQNQKCTEWPETDLEHLAIKNTLNILNFRPFCSTTSRFQDTMLLTIKNFENVPNDLRLSLKS